jgi:hypothetical protein
MMAIIISLALLLAGCVSVEGEVTDKRMERKTVTGIVLGKYPVKSTRNFYYVELDDDREIEVSREVYDEVVVGWTCLFSSDEGRFNYMKCEVE